MHQKKFQAALNIDASNIETTSIDQKALMFWEISVIDKKVNELVDDLYDSGSAKYKLLMPEKQRMQESSFIRRKLKLKETSKYLKDY